MNAFEKFKAGKYPQEIQNSIANFAECGQKYNETDSEYWFRCISGQRICLERWNDNGAQGRVES